MPAASSGSEREHFVDKFLAQVLPPVYRVGSGAATDAAGARSGQLDVVIELPFAPNIPMPGGNERMYLAESVLACLEVKSDLSRQWAEVQLVARQLFPLQRKLDALLMVGEGAGPRIPLFAIGYRGYQTLEGLKQRFDSTIESERPDGLLVIDPGLYYSPRVQAHGPPALFALIGELIDLTRSTIIATPDLWSYVRT